MPNEKEVNEKTEQDQEDEHEEEGEEELEAEGEEVDDDEDSDDGPHPGEIISSVVGEINDQLKRLESRNAGNLKFELANNVYPIILSILEPLLQWMASIEEDLDDLAGDEEDDVDPAVQKAMEEGTKRVISVCEKIDRMDKEEKVLGEKGSQDWKEVASWAKETLASVKSQQPATQQPPTPAK